jgi:hypothetical protein
MTNIADCLQRAIDFGEMDRQIGIEIIREYDQLVARYSSRMPEAQAKARAAADLKEANKAKTARLRHVRLNQLQAMARLRQTILTSKDPAAAIKGLIEYNPLAGSKAESVRSLAEAYESNINAALKKVLDETGTNVIGNSRNVKLLESLIMELHDEPSGNLLAKTLAATVRDQQQRMRRAFNSFGGDIGDLADFGVTHSHDAGQLRLKGFKTWSETIHTLLAWDRISDNSTGKPFAAKGQLPAFDDVRAFLQDVYDGIITRGLDDRDPSMAMGGRALANQRAEHRVLHFKGGKAWLEYNREFGTSDPFSAMIGGLRGLAGDVALMRVLGPNPRTGLNFAIQVAEKRAVDLGDAKLTERVGRAGKTALAMLAHQNGSANVPHHVGWARFFGGVRSTLTGIQLGSAVVSSVTDVATISAAATSIGLNPLNVLSRSIQLMASRATRETAARAGYVAETLADSGGTMARYFGKTFGTGLPDRLASFTMRATGLSFLTDMNKIAFQMEFAGHLADMAGSAFADINPRTRMMLERRGITAADWDMMRDPATRFYPQGQGGPNGGPSMSGPDFMTPYYWLETQTKLPRVEAEGLAMRWQMAIQEQIEMAIPSASLEGRAWTIAGQPGSFMGEVSRNVGMYKSFTVSLMINQYRRFAEAESWGRNRWAYASIGVSIPLVLLGALALQNKQILLGNDPRPMNTWSFWGAALMQGGGLGIFGDFFNASESRTGGGFAETLGGPVFGLADDIAKPIVANTVAAVRGDNTFFGRDTANFVRNNTPFLTSAWYARTAYSRLVADNLQAFLDPEAELIFRRRIKRMAKDYGTQPFIPSRGTGASLRLPDLSNALGGDQ